MNKKVKIYAEVLEDSALEQFNSAMGQDFVVSGALMPDAHTGYSLPIGAVVATKDVIVPSWVGYDIGCGMCALRLAGVTKEDIEENSKTIFERIYKAIPVGANKNNTEKQYSIEGLTEHGKEIAIAKRYKLAIGSLGGGNHFIEIGYDDICNSVWVVIHSGSRGVGHGIAKHYMEVAKEVSSELPPDLKYKLETEFESKNNYLKQYMDKGNYLNLQQKYVHKNKPKMSLDGHYGLDVNSQEGKDYIQDLKWALDYALENRLEMLKRVVHCIIGTNNIDYNSVINRNHNHAESKDGLWIHRKGATHAEKGMLGVIPGNMLDGSFIVKGLGNEDSLCSSSHGAGRVLSRKKAKETLDVEEFKYLMKGITAKVGKSTLDESPFAYKNINEVMRLQNDLVEVVTHIKPLINIKA